MKVIFPFKTVFYVTGLILHMHLHIYNSAADSQNFFHKVAEFAKIHSGMNFSGYILGSWIISDYICWVEFPFHELLPSSSSSLL